MDSRTPKRLSLRREMMRELTSDELAGLAGGTMRTFVACTLTCDTCRSCQVVLPGGPTRTACTLTCDTCLSCELCG